MNTDDKIYYSDDKITIRGLRVSDAQPLADAEVAQGWHTKADKFLLRISDRDSGKCIPLAAECSGEAAGYVSVYFDPHGTPFSGMGHCAIVDFAVLEKYRRRGIGSKLMDAAEAIAAEHSDVVFLAVGLYDGYGNAQRMYAKRGYIPDGSGAWYESSPAKPYQTYRLDDSLLLYLSKRLIK